MTENYIQKAKEIHGDKYDYSKTIYTKSRDKIIIICNIHGEFSQNAANHLTGRGCKECSKKSMADKKRGTKENFVIKSQSIHGDKYTYDKVVFLNVNDKVIVTCKIHGDFEVTPAHHYQGDGGCKKCAVNKLSNLLKLKPEEFIQKAREIHGNKYDYSLIKDTYVNNNTNVSIICKVHGKFEQLPITHINNKSGCPKCGLRKKG